MYVTADEFRKRTHRNLPDDITEDEIGYVLEDASSFLRSTYIQIPDEPEGTMLTALRVVTIAIAKRALLAERNAQLTGGAESITDTGGPFSFIQSFRNSEGNLYISSQERELIENELGKIEGSRQFRCLTAEGW